VDGRSGLVVGTPTDLLALVNTSRLLDARVTVAIAQPGLSRDQMTNQQAELLACTELYLSETYGSEFRVLCSA
jgi:hypothetical protein